MALTKLAELRARRALSAAGLATEPDVSLTRVESVTNEVWSHGDVLVRVSGAVGTRLRREADLARHLPAALRYPTILAVGEDGGVDWLVLERAPGVPLVRCWPGMTERERRSAVEQLAVAVRALHETPAPPDLVEPVASPHILRAGAHAVAPLLAALDRAAGLAHVDPGVIAQAVGFVRALAPALDPFTSTTLIHGDLHFQNVLWDGSELTAVLDLEFARAAPPDLDLDVFLRFCSLPFLFVPEGREAEARAELYASVPFWFRDAYPAVFEHPRLLDRLRVYAVAFDVWSLLAGPPQQSIRGLTQYHPYRRLVATLRGQSHLDLLNRD